MTTKPVEKADYACLGCGRLFARGDEHLFPEWQHEECGGLVREFAPAFVAAPAAPITTPTVKVDLEELERVIKQALPMTMRNESPCEARVALRTLIAEVRASRAGAAHVGSCAGCFFAEAELLDALRDGAEAGEPAEKLLKRVLHVLRDESSRPACPPRSEP